MAPTNEWFEARLLNSVHTSLEYGDSLTLDDLGIVIYQRQVPDFLTVPT